MKKIVFLFFILVTAFTANAQPGIPFEKYMHQLKNADSIAVAKKEIQKLEAELSQQTWKSRPEIRGGWKLLYYEDLGWEQVLGQEPVRHDFIYTGNAGQKLWSVQQLLDQPVYKIVFADEMLAESRAYANIWNWATFDWTAFEFEDYLVIKSGHYYPVGNETTFAIDRLYFFQKEKGPLIGSYRGDLSAFLEKNKHLNDDPSLRIYALIRSYVLNKDSTCVIQDILSWDPYIACDACNFVMKHYKGHWSTLNDRLFIFPDTQPQDPGDLKIQTLLYIDKNGDLLDSSDPSIVYIRTDY